MIETMRIAIGVFLLASPASALMTPPHRVRHKSSSSSSPSELYGNTKSPPEIPAPKELSYAEISRRYRRTVYSHDDWVKHRSPDRFIRNILTTISSGVYKNVGREVMATVFISTFIFFWNMITTGYTDFSGIEHPAIMTLPFATQLSLPLVGFNVVSPFIGLLLVFRTNAAYNRWDEARKNWGRNINHTRDLVRMANAFYDTTNRTPGERKRDLERVSLATWAFVRAMKRHLSPENEDEELFRKELYLRLPERQADAIVSAAHRPNRALYDLSMAIENLPMHFMRKNQIQESVTIFENNLGSSERLLTSPVPIFYNRHVARFLSFWLLFLPFALYEPFKGTWNHIAMIPASAILSLFLFGIEELATQMEEPFTILPMQGFCDKIYNWCNEIVSWADGDNGITTRKSYEGHMSVFFEPEEGLVVKSKYFMNE